MRLAQERNSLLAELEVQGSLANMSNARSWPAATAAADCFHPAHLALRAAAALQHRAELPAPRRGHHGLADQGVPAQHLEAERATQSHRCRRPYVHYAESATPLLVVL